jgi:hypothetical protein
MRTKTPGELPHAAGQTVAVWDLKDVFVSDDVVSASTGALPREHLHFDFGSITPAASAASVSGHPILKVPPIPTLPPSFSLVPPDPLLGSVTGL